MRLCDWYCVAMPMRRMPELRQVESAKSMMRNLPPKGTAGFARHSVSGPRRAPRPPARTMDTVCRASCAIADRSGIALGMPYRLGSKPCSSLPGPAPGAAEPDQRLALRGRAKRLGGAVRREGCRERFQRLARLRSANHDDIHRLHDALIDRGG